MADIAALVNDLGGVAHKKQLVRRGARDRDLTRAVRDGEVIRIRQGWYSTRDDDDPGVRAIRVGGRLTGISALIAAGAWVLGNFPLHVAVPRNASRLRNPGDRTRRLYLKSGAVVVHWVSADRSERGSVTSVALMDALVQVVLDEELEVAVAALDWALRNGEIDATDFDTLVQMLPQYKRSIRVWVSPVCDSLPESLTRTRLRLCGHTVTPQVPTGSNQRIDLVVDDLVAIETDGEEFHRDRFNEDRRKDITVTIDGYHVLRPSARMVFYEWPRVYQAVLSALTARQTQDHDRDGLTRPPDRVLLRPPSRRGFRSRSSALLAAA
jgi:very-short-patch-repair endonuclease